MSREQAFFILNLLPKHSYRRVSEIIGEAYPELVTELGWELIGAKDGVQALGIDLCLKARNVLKLKPWSP